MSRLNERIAQCVHLWGRRAHRRASPLVPRPCGRYRSSDVSRRRNAYAAMFRQCVLPSGRPTVPSSCTSLRNSSYVRILLVARLTTNDNPRIGCRLVSRRAGSYTRAPPPGGPARRIRPRDRGSVVAREGGNQSRNNRIRFVPARCRRNGTRDAEMGDLRTGHGCAPSCRRVPAGVASASSTITPEPDRPRRKD